MAREAIKYRQAIASDVQFIIRSWIDSYKGAHGAGILSIPEFAVPCECGRPIRYDFSAVMEVTLAKLLQRPGLTAWVAYDPSERAPYDIYGYLVSETGANMPTYQRDDEGELELKVKAATEPLIHYLFIKRTFRGRGIARALLKVAGIDARQPFLYTCRTANCSKLEKAGLMPCARWFPLSARFPKSEKNP